LVTMTMLTPAFSAPQRQRETFDASRRSAWRPLLVSTCIHGLGIVAVVVITQWSLDRKNERMALLPPSQEIKARLYTPVIPNREKKTNDALVAPDKNMPQANTTEPTTAESSPTESSPPKSLATQSLQTVEPESARDANPVGVTDSSVQENTQRSTKHTVTPTVDANRNAGSLNLSVESATAQYLDNYYNERVSEDARQAAKNYLQRKNSPSLSGPSTQEIQANENKRPITRVNCSNTLNKTIALVTALTGGALACSDLPEHDQFIDARVKKLPNDEDSY